MTIKHTATPPLQAVATLARPDPQAAHFTMHERELVRLFRHMDFEQKDFVLDVFRSIAIEAAAAKGPALRLVATAVEPLKPARQRSTRAVRNAESAHCNEVT